VEYRDEKDRLLHAAMAGWPILGNEVRVVDSSMHEVARDMITIGEVVIRGDNVMDEYFREPEATAAAMSEGWLHTGDMAVWDEENYIQIFDRKKDIIITGVENVSSIEVENAICAHTAVLECAVVAAPHPKWGEVVAAIITLKPGEQASHAELTAFLEPRLAKFKLPCIVEFREEPLPRTGTGKILKRERGRHGGTQEH
jgi:fatty-acyl-CoA synthase